MKEKKDFYGINNIFQTYFLESISPEELYIFVICYNLISSSSGAGVPVKTIEHKATYFDKFSKKKIKEAINRLKELTILHEKDGRIFYSLSKINILRSIKNESFAGKNNQRLINVDEKNKEFQEKWSDFLQKVKIYESYKLDN
jgi:hypothetical protein